MRHRPPWQEIRKLPTFTRPRYDYQHNRIIYFHFYLPSHVMRVPPLFIEVCGTQLLNGLQPRPYHWYVSAFNPKSGLALAYLWHENIAQGEWITIDMEGILTLKVGRWQVRNDRTWQPKQLVKAIREALAVGQKEGAM